MLNGDLRLFADTEALSLAAAQRWVQLSDAAITARGRFHVALSGGSTPRALYRRLAQPEFARRIAWERVHIYFGDERAVPPDHPDSNFLMAKEALLEHVPILPVQIYRIEGERADIQEAATKYSQLLASRLPLSAQGVVQFDLLLLGVGTDGHIASLFPGTAVLHERARFVEAVFVEKLKAWRVTVTLPVIDHARQVMILVSGESKAPLLRDLVSGRRSPPYPVQLINPQGVLEWYVDGAAASLLPTELRS